jgi:hypothetical protein
MSEEEMSQSLIIVMLAEPDPEQYLETISKVLNVRKVLNW